MNQNKQPGSRIEAQSKCTINKFKTEHWKIEDKDPIRTRITIMTA